MVVVIIASVVPAIRYVEGGVVVAVYGQLCAHV